MMAIHAFAAIFRQQGRVDVYHAAVVSLDKEVGHNEQEPSQHDKLDVVFFQKRHHRLTVVEILLGDDGGGYSLILGAYQGKGISFVTHHEADLHFFRILEVFDDVFTVGAASRHEYGYVCHYCFLL